ncbi:MAG: aspartate carbamoyltransferase regulatory subunit [Clostridia bacterium]|nr:aspartate carbamoyltransferase regulatory subunit [Clostridia bacterium]
MNIDSIRRGIVLDHIQAGRSMEIYRALGLEELPCSVAIIRNVKSNAMGKKDIIKIDDDIDIDLDVLGYIDPGITVNIIVDGVITEKKHLALPRRLVNMGRCRNPRCITTQEANLDQVFVLADPARKIYRCLYCDAEQRGTDAP